MLPWGRKILCLNGTWTVTHWESLKFNIYHLQQAVMIFTSVPSVATWWRQSTIFGQVSPCSPLTVYSFQIACTFLLKKKTKSSGVSNDLIVMYFKIIVRSINSELKSYGKQPKNMCSVKVLKSNYKAFNSIKAKWTYCHLWFENKTHFNADMTKLLKIKGSGVNWVNSVYSMLCTA